MISHTFRLFVLAMLCACAGGMAHAGDALTVQATDTCAPWDGHAVEMRTTLPSGKLFVARIWQPDKLATSRGLDIDNQYEGGVSAGNASICKDPEHTEFMDCKPVIVRITAIDAKDGDTGAGTLYIEDMGTFSLNVHWTHSPQFCG